MHKIEINWNDYNQFLAEIYEAENEKVEQEADYWVNQYKEDKF